MALQTASSSSDVCQFVCLSAGRSVRHLPREALQA